jgi:hypothetical protein
MLYLLESADLGFDTPGYKVVEHINKFNFGRQPGVPTFTMIYLIDFTPTP